MIEEPRAYRSNAHFKRRDNSITRLTTVETLPVGRYIGILLISVCVWIGSLKFHRPKIARHD